MPSHALKGRVESGKVTVDEKTDLPDGEVLLVPVKIDDLDDEERARLDAIIEESVADEKAGRVEDFFDAVRGLRARS